MNQQLSKQIRAARIIFALRRLYPRVRTALSYADVWQLLVATMLSAQTTDKTVNEVTRRLFKKYRSVRAYAASAVPALAQDIRRVNYYKTKARHIRAAARIIEKQYRGTVPLALDALIALPGVGRKTANVVVNELTKRANGIAVDTHVARLSRLLGLTDEHTPSLIERDLMRVVPRRHWRGISLRLIAYGREHCPARPHHHAKCPLRAWHRRRSID